MTTGGGQTIMDIAIQETGSIDGVLDIMERNGMALDEHFRPGREIKTGDPINSEVVSYIRDRNLEIATGSPNELDYPGGAFNDDWHFDFD